MARKFTERRLVIASHNKGKVGEIADLLKYFGTEVVSAETLGLPEPELQMATVMLRALSDHVMTRS